jgi:hypothetical protein
MQSPTDARADVVVAPVDALPEHLDARDAPLDDAGESTDLRVRHTDRLVELAAVVLLGAGTLFAAWSGYQSSIWNGIQAGDYVQGSGRRVESTRASTEAGQDRLYDSQVFSQWLNAYVDGKTKLATIYERRFRQEFRVAFSAWLATDPLNNPGAPQGPLFMKEYVSASAQRADALEAGAAALVQAGEEANATSDKYVLYTVVFATVLFLVAVIERFKWRTARIGVLVIGLSLLAFGVAGLVQLPIG